jgi:hypothetical protein
MEACAKPGCPFCTLSELTVRRFLDAVMYEDVNDPAFRERLRQTLGYCNEHAWRLTQLPGGTALGVAIIYQDLLRTVEERLGQVAFEPGGPAQRAGDWLNRGRPAAATLGAVRAVSPHQTCPACAQREQMEDLALTAMLDGLARRDAPLEAALRRSAGLCLEHLRRALALARGAAQFEFLRELTRAKLRTLADEVGEFIRKNDYRFRHEGFGAEGDSWKRAVAMMVGERGVR